MIGCARRAGPLSLVVRRREFQPCRPYPCNDGEPTVSTLSMRSRRLTGALGERDAAEDMRRNRLTKPMQFFYLLNSRAIAATFIPNARIISCKGLHRLC